MAPILLQTGPITIFSYGFLIALGFLTSSFLVFRQAKKEYFDEEKVFDIIFLSVVGGIFGARLFYVIEHFDSFGFSFFNWLLINARPGLSLWGGLGVGTAVFLLSVKNKKLPLYKMFDLTVFPLLVAFFFGEIGSFLAGSEIGLPTSLPWGVIYYSTLKRHPVSLYKGIIVLLLIFLFIKLKQYFLKKRVPSGSLFFSLIIAYSFFYFIIAFFKEDVIVIGHFLRIEQLVYLVLLLTGITLLYSRLGRNFTSDLKSVFSKVKILTRIGRRNNEKVSS